MEMLLPAPVALALGRLSQAGFPAYVVGGCVRDAVLGVPPHDYDLCTAARPEEMRRVFAGERVLETGARHGTLTVLLQGAPLEITTFRLDGEYQDGRHPAAVQFTRQITEDLSRRDFTINAMAYAPGEGLVDPFGGRRDCAQGVIRCVGRAERRFEEDALRILRALRFSARLGFLLEADTARALHALRGNLARISRERIAAECGGLLLGDWAAPVLRAYGDVLFSALPSLAETGFSFADPLLNALPLLPREPALRWAALLFPLPSALPKREEIARALLRGLKLSNQLTDTVCSLVREQFFPLRQDTLLETLMRMGPEGVERMLLLRSACAQACHPGRTREIQAQFTVLEQARRQLIAQNACFSLKQLAVKGPDLTAQGLRGPQIGQALQQLLALVAQGRLPNEKEALLAALRNITRE